MHSSTIFPLSKYSLDDTYFEELLPGRMTDIVQNSTTAPISRVFAVQRPARTDENSYISVGIVPLIRSVPYNITTGSGASQITTNFLRLYLVNIEQGALTTTNPDYITLTGGAVEAKVIPSIQSIKITVFFPKEARGYDSDFFNYPTITQVIDFGTSGAEIELYLGNVEVGFSI